MSDPGAARLGEAGRGKARQGTKEDEDMQVVTVSIKGVSPYSQSRAIQSLKSPGEGADAFEQRSWRERMHTHDDGTLFLPPMCIKNCLSDVAKYLSESVPGKGKATYTKHFEAGILITCEWRLTSGNAPIRAAEVPGERLFVPASGKRGDGKRVWRTFPRIMPWEAHGEIYLLDPVLVDKPEKVREYLEHAGKFIGIGRFRPRNNGYYGRFEVVTFE
jgi:hypothetical protein